MIAATILSTGCYKPNESRRDTAPNEVTVFPTLFATNCSGCHGARGQQGPAPPIGSELFLAMISKDELQEIVTKGRAGTLMPAFVTSSGEGLTTKQAEIIAQGLKSGDLNQSQPGDRPQLVPPYRGDPASSSAADVAAGAMLFANHCAECHGEDGRDGAMAGPLNDPALLALLSDRAIRTLIITGRADLKRADSQPMPSYLTLSKVTPENTAATWREIDQIVAYIASWRNSSAQETSGTLRPTREKNP